MSAQANPNYRVEHVAEAPRGWRVRTKMMSTHILRIAFPPGPRKKGAGKVIEIFHPVNENPCSMPTKVGTKEKRNPGATEEASALYEDFHGKSPKEILELQESDAARQTFTALGDLQELVIDAPAGKVKIGFSSADRVKVASAPGGKQLYLLGGNQNLDSQLEQFGSDPGKDFVELGAAVQITYQARKSMDNFTLVNYWHKLGEETGEPPLAFYDRLKRRIFLAGGRYRVEAPGIIN